MYFYAVNIVVVMNNKKIYYFLFGFLFLSSCTFFTKKKSADFLKVDTVIDYTSVDVYPLFLNCKELENKEQQQSCFEREMTQKIHQILQLQSFDTFTVLQDTAWVKLVINKKGNIQVTEVNSNTLSEKKIKRIDSILQTHLQKITPLQPAIKRGIPVTTLFKVPIVLNTQKK